jgi:hypothetical protein
MKSMLQFCNIEKNAKIKEKIEKKDGLKMKNSNK